MEENVWEEIGGDEKQRMKNLTGQGEDLDYPT